MARGAPTFHLLVVCAAICLSTSHGVAQHGVLTINSEGSAQAMAIMRSEKKTAVEVSESGTAVLEAKKVAAVNCAPLTNHGSHSTVTIQVGTPLSGSPAQKFDVVADTGSDNVIVPSCNCERTGRCKSSDSCFQGTNRSETFVLAHVLPNETFGDGAESRGPKARKSGSVVQAGKTDKKEKKEEPEAGKTDKEEEDPEDQLKEVLLTFGSGQIEAVIATDVVQLAGVKALMKEGVLLMVDQLLQISGKFNGILGLGTPAKKEIHASNSTATSSTDAGFLEVAGIEQFSLCFNQEKDGVLRLDPPAQDPARQLGSIGTFHWGLDFRGISVGNETAPVEFCKQSDLRPGQKTACGIIPDSGTTVMMADEAHLVSLFTQICTQWPRCAKTVSEDTPPHHAFQVLLNDCQSWSATGNYKELPSIFFHVVGAGGNEQVIEMDAHDYVLESLEEDVHHVTKFLMGIYPVSVAEKSGKKKLVCAPAFGKTDFSTKQNGPVWIWGTPLFYKFQVQYDISSNPPSISLINQPCGTCSDSQSLIATERQDIDRSSGKKARRLTGPVRLPSFQVGRERL